MQERKTMIALQNQAAKGEIKEAEQDNIPASEGEETTGRMDTPEKLDDEELIVTGTDTDISPEEVEMLERTDGFEASADEESLIDASLDSADEDDEELNVESFGEDLAGNDLDVPATEDDNEMEEIGEEDEENNIYSDDDQGNSR